MSERIIELIKKNNKITIKELVEEIEITQRTVERYLKKLQRIGGRRYIRMLILKNRLKN